MLYNNFELNEMMSQVLGSQIKIGPYPLPIDGYIKNRQFTTPNGLDRESF